MDLGSIFLILALLVLVGLFVGRPLLEDENRQADLIPEQQEHERSALLAERDRILNALQELDFDHALGKIPQEDYPQQRLVLAQRGAQVLRRLDELLPESGVSEVEARLEAALSRNAAVAVAEPDDELEILIANRRRARLEKAAGFCPQCGGPVQKSDHFCPKCGAKIT